MKHSRIAPEYLEAVNHRIRVAILAALFNRTVSLEQLAAEVGCDRRTLTRHAGHLERLGLITAVPGSTGPAYRLVLPPEFTDDEWRRASPAVKQSMAAATLGTVHATATAAVAAGGFDDATMHLTRTPLTIDEETWNYISQEMMRVLHRIDTANARAASRVVQSGEEPIHATAVMMLFRNAPQGTGNYSDELRGYPVQLTEDEALERTLDLLEEVDRLRRETEDALTTVGPNYWGARLIALADELRVLGRLALSLQNPAATQDARTAKRSEPEDLEESTPA